MRMLAGFVIGVSLGLAVSAIAAPMIAGGNGYLFGWSVTYRGKTICDDPFIWAGTKEVECG